MELSFIKVLLIISASFVLLSWVVKTVNADESKLNSVKFLSAKCNVLEKTWIKMKTCRVKSLSRNLTVLNIEANLLKQLNEPIFITSGIYLKSSARVFNSVWPKTRYEFCSAMRNEGLFGQMIFFIIGFFRDSVPQLFQKCPYRPGYFDFRNITVDNSKRYPLDKWIPEGTYKLKTKISHDKVDIFELELQSFIKSGLDWSKWGNQG